MDTQLDGGKNVTPGSYMEPDELLQNLVSLVNGTVGLNLGITLQIGGMLVSGTLIAGDEYLKEYGEQFISAIGLTGEVADEARNDFALKAKGYTKFDDDPEMRASEPAMVHLRNARFVHQSGNPIPGSGGGILWRGRLVEVSGFCLGTIAAK